MTHLRPEDRDDSRPIFGIFNGLIFSAIVWALIVAMVWAVMR